MSRIDIFGIQLSKLVNCSTFRYLREEKSQIFEETKLLDHQEASGVSRNRISLWNILFARIESILLRKSQFGKGENALQRGVSVRRGKYSFTWHASLTITKRRESSSKRSVTFRIIPAARKKQRSNEGATRGLSPFHSHRRTPKRAEPRESDVYNTRRRETHV